MGGTSATEVRQTGPRNQTAQLAVVHFIRKVVQNDGRREAQITPNLAQKRFQQALRFCISFAIDFGVVFDRFGNDFLSLLGS